MALSQAQAFAARGQHLLAADAARLMLSGEHAREAAFLLVRELCRGDATAEARREFDDLAPDLASELGAAALAARIRKDEAALLPPGAPREQALLEAARAYQAASLAGDAYALINAATLSHIAGDTRRARHIAEMVLAQSPRPGYFGLACHAEAWVLLGDFEHARALFARAVRDGTPTLADIATTRRQLHLLARLGGVDPLDIQVVLDGLGQPAVMHFCGQMGTAEGGIGTLSADQVDTIRGRIQRALAAEPVGVAYGGLASGGDLVFAECVLAAGMELQVVLPFPPDEFKRVSVMRFGADWAARFDWALACATGVTIASETDYSGNDRSFDFGTKLAMGLALQRARHLVTPVVQMAVHDGRVQQTRPVGTEANLRFWRCLGLRSIIFDANRDRHDAPPARPPRGVLPIVLLRLNGFQMLAGGELPPFLDDVLGRFGQLLDDAGELVSWRAIWGDGAVATVTDLTAAAELGLATADALRSGFDAVRVRMGLHYGQLADVPDPALASAPLFGVLAEHTPMLESGIYASAAFTRELAELPAAAALEAVPIPAVANGATILRRLA